MTVRVPVTRRGDVVAYALIDDADAERVLARKWSLTGNGYAQGSVAGFGNVSMHRLVCGLGVGDGGSVHHRNENKLDNRRLNLRVYDTHREHVQDHCGTQTFERRFGRLARAVKIAARLEIAATRHDVVRYARGCRCDVCRQANTDRMRAYFRQKAAERRAA